jgi:hypothetical protein
MSKHFAALCVLAFCWVVPAQATTVCAWMKESVDSDQMYSFDVWVQADSEVDFLYQIGGKGVVTESMTGNSPGSGTYSLHAGVAEKMWGYGSTLNPPGKIDFSVELHQTPKDVFSDAPTPLLARFLFQRNVPASETRPPATLAKKQCLLMKSVR